MSSRHTTLRSALRGAGLASLTAAAVTVTLTATPGAAVAAPVAGPVAEGPGVFVTPVSPAPGTDIVLAVSGCAERTATATSDAFVADARLAGADGTLVGESRVRSSARPGKYDVRVVCGTVRFEGVLTVAAPAPLAFPAAAVSMTASPSTASTAPSPGRASTTSPEHASATPAAPLTSASPVAPVYAGGGGTAGLVAVDAVAAVDDTDGSRASGPGAAQSATGLVLAAAAAVAVALRGSRRRRESD
jgi:hypothetical protein